jgi:hypothetical protein
MNTIGWPNSVLWHYAEVSTYQPGQSIAPLNATDQWVAVEDLLP